MKGIVVAFLCLTFSPAAIAADTPEYQIWEFGTRPRPAFKEVLLEIPVVVQELKITADQKASMAETRMRLTKQFVETIRGIKDRDKVQEARMAYLKALSTAVLANLEPRQRDRLDQIQLQSQGPIAFNRSDYPALEQEGPGLADRLKFTDDQRAHLKKLDAEAEQAILKAAAMPIDLGPDAGPPTLESIRKLVDTPEYRTAKQKARADARKEWASAVEMMEKVLTEDQRLGYRVMVGEPFDLSKIRFSEDEAAEDVDMIASALNVGGAARGGGQQSDPDFDAKVAHPAYAEAHPRVLFDEAHFNFHTTDGRYKPFAQLIANDGYQVIPNKEKFSADLFSKGDVLIIANALGADGMGEEGSSNPAFTDAECDAVRDWVRKGGSLLLITDHAPFGSAAETLAKRFGVDMSKGFTSDPQSSEGGETFLVFSRENHLLADHPITSGRDDSERIKRIQTFTGQSLKGPEGSVPFLKLGKTASDAGEDGNPISAAGRSQGLAFAFGDGRVVVMGEAAELSAQVVGTTKFGMNVPGIDNRQMALNIMHWLSGLLEPRAAAK